MAEAPSNPDRLAAFLRDNGAAALYFSDAGCNVCVALKPKVLALFAEAFPRIAIADVDCTKLPEVAAQLGVLAAPTLIVWFDGKEWLRRYRTFSLPELEDELQRPYSIYFSDEP